MKVLIYGDSLVYGVSLAEACIAHHGNDVAWDSTLHSFPGVTAAVFASEECSQTIRIPLLSDLVQAGNFDAVVLSAGTNDCVAGNSMSVIRSLKSMYEVCREHSNVLLIGCGVPGATAVNNHLKLVAANEPDFIYSPFLEQPIPGHLNPDQLHLNKSGQEEFARHIKQLIYERLMHYG